MGSAVGVRGLCVGVFLLLVPLAVHAADVRLAWNASVGTVTGYRLHVGTASGVYAKTVEVGNALTGTVPQLTPGTRYFFAVTAYNATGESGFSNEVAHTIPVPVPAPVSVPEVPGALRITVTIDVLSLPPPGGQ